MFRPQFPFKPPPPGFVYQPVVYQWSQDNVPALGSVSLLPGQESAYIPLQIDRDVPFILQGIRIQNGGVNVLLWDPFNNQLMDTYERPSEYASEQPPISVLEGGAGDGEPPTVPPGAVFLLKLQGQ